MRRSRDKDLEVLKFAATKFDYDPATGVFRYSMDTYQKSKRGMVVEAGWELTNEARTHSGIYGKGLRIYMNKKPYRVSAHRLAWFMVHGEIPDTINRLQHCTSPCDSFNRISNLENVTSRAAASHRLAIGQSVYTGVCRNKDGWAAQIKINGVHKTLGRFKSEFVAANVYANAVRELSE